jgi:tetratricopeptide (TPR) repeat protein
MQATQRIKVLFLSANPTDTDTLRIDQEYRTIDERLRAADYRDRFELVSSWAVRPQDIQAALLRYRPAVVHFSGHADDTGAIAVENAAGETHSITADALVSLFRVFNGTVRCIVLNACYSDIQAEALAEHIDCVIGMSTSIGDEAAIAFSSAFYQALAYGEDVNSAFKLGCSQIELEGLGEELTPSFHLRDGLTAFRLAENSEMLGATGDTSGVGTRSEVLPLARALAAVLDQAVRSALQSTGPLQSLGFVSQLVPNTELPSTVERVARRPQTVARVHDGYVDHSYVAIYGSSGAGKSQLAILASQDFTGRRVWIPLRRRADGSETIVTGALQTLSVRPPPATRRDLYRDVCASLGPKSIVILDDLPATSGHEELDAALADLCTACHEYGVCLLTTSARRLPWRTRDAVGRHLYEMPAPRFLDSEVVDLFRSYGAPEAFLQSRWLKLSEGSAMQHPVLLVEAARYLQTRGWSTNAAVFDDLLLGRFARTLDVRTTEDIQRTVSDPATRDLLYRLKLISWPFVADQVRDVSDVPPVISSPMEKLAELLGLWIQQDGISEYVLSPLVSRLDDSNVQHELRRKVHQAVATGIMDRVRRKRTFGPEEASQAIIHFVGAAQFDDAATILVLALHGMMQQRTIADHFSVSSIWVGMPLPDAISHENKIYVRALQIVVRHQLGRDVSELLDDLDRLLSIPETVGPRIVRVGMCALVATELANEQPERALRYLVDSLRSAEDHDIGSLHDEDVDWREGLLNLFWMLGFNSKTDQAFESWFQVLRESSPEQIANLQSVQLADRCCEFICAGIWMREADRPSSDQNWNSALRSLQTVHDWARGVQFPVLAACALRGQVVVQAEYRNDLAGAVKIGEEYLRSSTHQPKSRFLVSDIIARQFAYQRQTDKALEWFDSSLKDAESMAVQWRIETLAVAGSAASWARRECALDYFEEALRLVGPEAGGQEHTEEMPPLLVIKVAGEKALAYWRLDDRRNAYSLWSSAIQNLLITRTGNEDWIILLRLFGAYTSYFVQIVRGVGELVPGTLEPQPGLLLRAPKGLVEDYVPGQEWTLAGAMATLADALGQFEDAVSWATRSLEMAPGGEKSGLRISFGLYSLPHELDATDYEKILLDAVRDDLLAAKEGGEQASEDAKRTAGMARIVAAAKATIIILEIGRTLRQDGSKARALTSTLAARLRAVNTDGESFWEQVASAFSGLFSSEDSWRELFASAKSTSDNNVKMICGLAAVYGAPLPQAARLQITILKWLQTYIPATVFELVVLRAVQEFWQSALNRSTFQFSTPRLLRDVLTSLQSTVQSILFAVSLSLSVPLEAADRTWLNQSSG